MPLNFGFLIRELEHFDEIAVSNIYSHFEYSDGPIIVTDFYHNLVCFNRDAQGTIHFYPDIPDEVMWPLYQDVFTRECYYLLSRWQYLSDMEHGIVHREAYADLPPLEINYHDDLDWHLEAIEGGPSFERWYVGETDMPIFVNGNIQDRVFDDDYCDVPFSERTFAERLSPKEVDEIRNVGSPPSTTADIQEMQSEFLMDVDDVYTVYPRITGEAPPVYSQWPESRYIDHGDLRYDTVVRLPSYEEACGDGDIDPPKYTLN